MHDNMPRHATNTSFKPNHVRSQASIDAQKATIAKLVQQGRWTTQLPEVSAKLKVPNPSKGNSGPRNGRWHPVGTKKMVAGGHYIKIKISEPNIWEYEHRVVAEARIGRKLTHLDHVHHINCDKTDNRSENLVVMSHKDHARLPKSQNGHPRCPICGYCHPPHN